MFDSLSKKDLYAVKALAIRQCKKYWENTSHKNSTQITYDGLKGHVFDVSLADL